MLKKLFLLLISAAAITLAANEPLLRVGSMSDTHVTRDISSCGILKDTFELFKQHKVDLILNSGDIADVYDAEAYRNYRNTFNTVFTDSAVKPQEIFAYAYHDVIGHQSNDPWSAFKDVKRYLEATNNPYDIVKVKGYTFVVLPQYHEVREYKKLLDTAEKMRDGKPFFIVDHVPLHNTVAVSLNGNSKARELVSRHPDAIHISGHNHSLLTNELNIWQGEFTAINAGFLHGSMVVKKTCDVAMVMDIYRDKIICKRFFTDSQKQYKSDANWIIPLPFNKKTAPYSRENRLKNSVAPAFPADAKITISQNTKGVTVRFPQAVKADDIYKYKLELLRNTDGKLHSFADYEITGPFETGLLNVPTHPAYTFSIGYFDYGAKYQVKVTPVHFSGRKGTPLETDFVVTAKSDAKVVFESRNPMNECFATIGTTGKNDHKTVDAKVLHDGFYHIDGEKSTLRVYFPSHIWKSKTGGRVVIDAQVLQGADRTIFFQMRCLEPRKFIPQRAYTTPGNILKTRYVIEFNKLDRDDYNFYLNMKDGGKGRIKIDYIRIERY